MASLPTVASAANPAATSRAAAQAGVFDHGYSVTAYNPKNPIILFIIQVTALVSVDSCWTFLLTIDQAGIIIIFCRALQWPLAKLRQPRVIAEVIGGIVLGPSVMGRIPGFSDTIFPAASMPNLTLVANLGLVLFLFLVGLEVDVRYLMKHWWVATSVGAAGMALPFGLGCAIAYGLYHAFGDEPNVVHVDFPLYMLFIGVAMAITAFPVLCRILTELKLLSTPVGVIVLAAGVANDVIGWILLALCVALVNANSGLTALWVLLTCVAFTLFMVFAVRPAFLWILRRGTSLQDGPTQPMIALTIFIALASSFFTGIIGVHPIFGAFLAGLCNPHEGGFAVKVAERIEDLITILLLPLYFALSGLSTNLGLLDDGKTWGYVCAVIAVALFGKLIGGSGAARANGMVWRECFTIGTLMSCKGLVELIVLNIGLQAKILSVKTFTIFVVMALVTTFMTTPLVAYLYPPSYQYKLEAWKRGEIEWETGRALSTPSDDTAREDAFEKRPTDLVTRRILIYLRLDSLPSLISLIGLVSGVNEAVEDTGDEKLRSRANGMIMHGQRLLQLTERDPSVMKVSEAAETSHTDPLVNIFRAIGRMRRIETSGEVSISLPSYYSDILVSKARELESDLLLVPWSDSESIVDSGVTMPNIANPMGARSAFDQLLHATFERVSSVTNMGVLVNIRHRHLNDQLTRLDSVRSEQDDSHDILVPFSGTQDDIASVRLALDFARNSHVRILIKRMNRARTNEDNAEAMEVQHTNATKNGVTVVQSSLSRDDGDMLDSLKQMLPEEVGARVNVDDLSADADYSSIAQAMVGEHTAKKTDIIIVGRNSGPSAGMRDWSLLADFEPCSPVDGPSSLGHLADAILKAQAAEDSAHRQVASVLVIQAKRAP